MKRLIVNEKGEGKKLTRYLLDSFPSLNLNLIYKTLRKKDIKVNGKRTSENITLHNGDVIEIYLISTYFESAIKEIPIVYEDSNILVVHKPTGIEVTGKGSMTSNLAKNYPYLSPCHRLDRNTSGLLLFAKSASVLDILLDSFKNHEIEKHYACLVYGIPVPSSKTLKAYLFKDAKQAKVYVSNTPKKGYQTILTSYTVLKTYSNHTSLLDVTLHTGRTHQIRAHLAYLGHPILGDGKYGTNEINKQFSYQTQQLCAYQLSFHFTKNHMLSYLQPKTFCLPIPFLEETNT